MRTSKIKQLQPRTERKDGLTQIHYQQMHSVLSCLSCSIDYAVFSLNLHISCTMSFCSAFPVRLCNADGKHYVDELVRA